jgi:ATP-dependent DNA ligase
MYLVFDLLCLNEEDIKGAPLVGRRGILRKLFPNGYDL